MSDSVFSENELTYREWHAAVLGGAVGAFAAYLQVADYANVGVALAVVFAVATLGVERYDSVASRTVRREPWYAFVAFLAVGAVVLAVA